MKIKRSLAVLIILVFCIMNITGIYAVNAEETYTNILLTPEDFSVTDTSAEARDKIISNNF